MTTDTKADQMDQYTSSSGRVWVPLTDHERVVGEHKDQLNKFIAEAERTFEVYETDLAALRAEVDGFRKDAERYRWLRDKAYKVHEMAPAVILAEAGLPCDDIRTDGFVFEDDLDERVDAAMESNNV